MGEVVVEDVGEEEVGLDGLVVSGWSGWGWGGGLTLMAKRKKAKLMSRLWTSSGSTPRKMPLLRRMESG